MTSYLFLCDLHYLTIIYHVVLPIGLTAKYISTSNRLLLSSISAISYPLPPPHPLTPSPPHPPPPLPPCFYTNTNNRISGVCSLQRSDEGGRGGDKIYTCYIPYCTVCPFVNPWPPLKRPFYIFKENPPPKSVAVPWKGHRSLSLLYVVR